MHRLEIVDLSARYTDKPVLEGINLSIGKGEIVSLIGPSGSGKSTLLRVLVGLLPPRSGQVVLDGKSINYRDKVTVKAIHDRFAMKGQSVAGLFRNTKIRLGSCQ